MKIHEYQAKELLKRYGVLVPAGRVATNAEQVFELAKSLMSGKNGTVVVKAQIHAGGRGKAGGIKVCRSPDEAAARAKEMLGMVLKTYQTGPAGQEVRKLLIEEGVTIDKEIYAGLVLDRETKRITFMLSNEGGVEIEEVAKKTPDKIKKVAILPGLGLTAHQIRELCFGIGLRPDLHKRASGMFMALYQAFVGTDASIIEINPLIITKDGDLLALDGKINFDDSALFRHPELNDLRDLFEEDPKEIEAKKYDLSYVALDGNIGCMVNGAGLAMATMDIIKHAGGEPANFLDVGGGATVEKVSAAFRIILEDKAVRAVLVNIFGGIMKCDTIAEGIIGAAKTVSLSVPVVVRLEGTNVELGKKMLADSGLALITADNMGDAAQKVVAAARSTR